jgi:hypothetical protein
MEAVRELRDKRENDGLKIFSDWLKRIGFLFIGLAIQQWTMVSSQNPIQSSSVTWLVIHSIVATALLIGGARIDRPLRWLLDWRWRHSGENRRKG